MITAKCRFCAAAIRRRLGQDWWEDSAGFTRCMKLPLADMGKATTIPGHQPMPDGLVGAESTGGQP